MKKFKHIIAIFIVLGILSLGAYLLPKSDLEGFLNQKDEVAAAVADSIARLDSIAAQDTTPFIDRMKNKLEVVQAQYSRRKKRDVWTLGNGATIINYLLQAQRFLNKNGGKVLYMEEAFNDRDAFQAALLDALDPNGDTLRLYLQISRNIFRDNASYLSVSFQVKSLSTEVIEALNALDFPYDLMIPPFGVSKEFYPDLDRIKEKEIVLWLIMESPELDSRHRKMRPIRSYLTEDQITEIISDAKKLSPNAVGIATRYADKAVEHKPLLQAVFNAAKENNLWFADLSLNKKSRVMELCPEVGISCRELSPYDPSNSNIDDYVHRKLRGAARNGISTIILPLSLESINKVKSLKEKATAQGTTMINLSTFMNTNKE